MLLKDVSARKIKDSRNEWTIEVSVNGCKASSPSGRSTGKYETPPYYKSIDFCIKFLNNLNEDIKIDKFRDLEKIEMFIKKKLKLEKARYFGGNSLFAFESAILKALAKEQKKELWQIIDKKAKKMPIPAGNAVGGGLHSHNKSHPIFQEFLIIPKRKSITENYRIMQNNHEIIGKEINSSGKNDEGAWDTSMNEDEILVLLSKFKDINIGIDIAASSFYDSKNYMYKGKLLDRNSQVHYINCIIKDYKISYIEDPLHEDDFSGFSKIVSKGMIVGDDLTATHLDRIKKAVKKKAINAVIIKPNQNGSLIEVAEIVKYCKKHKIKIIFSHRSGETMDDALADYAFGFQADYIKCGIATKWREAKLKRLIEIESNR